jgi:hypothetical protein
LKRKLRGLYPCGYGFDAFNDEKDAIVGVRLHLNGFTRIFFLLELLTLKH